MKLRQENFEFQTSVGNVEILLGWDARRKCSSTMCERPLVDSLAHTKTTTNTSLEIEVVVVYAKELERDY